jgi:cell division protein FtsQ
MKIREYQFPESNTDKAGNHDFEQRDPLKVKPAEPEKFVPPVLIEDLLHDDTVHTDDGHSTNGADPGADPASSAGAVPPDQVQHLRKKKRRLKRRKHIFHRVGPLIVLFLLFLLWLFLRFAPVPFGMVLIEGNDKMTNASVLRVCGVGTYVNVIQLSPSAMQDKLSHDLRVAEVSVSRELPATIRISLGERKAAAVMTTMYGFAYVDKNGVVISLEQQIKGVSVPLMTGKKMDTVLLGDTITDDSIRAALAYLDSLSPEILRNIAEINVGNPNKITAYTNDSIPIRLGNGDDPAERAKVTEELLQEVQSNRLDVQYIDSDIHAPLVKSK